MTNSRWLMILTGLVGVVACSREPAATGVVGAAALSKNGLIGQWAMDCGQGFGLHNPYLIYAVAGGGVPTEQLLIDGKRNRTTPLQDIAELAGGFVKWTEKADEGLATIVTKVEGRRLKTWRSVHADGTVLVSDGHFSGGAEVPLFSRCDAK